jgi:hypothetical protein
MNKVLKSICTSRYLIELRQIEDSYLIITEDDRDVTYSSPIYDYNLASYVFDMTVQQLEGF